MHEPGEETSACPDTEEFVGGDQAEEGWGFEETAGEGVGGCQKSEGTECSKE